VHNLLNLLFTEVDGGLLIILNFKKDLVLTGLSSFIKLAYQMWNSILRNKIVKLSHLTQFLNMCVDFIVLFRLTSLFIFLFACFVALRVLHLLLLLP